MKKKVLAIALISLVILLGLFVIAEFSNITTFTDGATEKNITLSAYQNTTVNISIPVYSIVLNFTMEIKGVSS